MQFQFEAVEKLVTQISEDLQTDTDFDWFCVDSAGEIGHFTTAGYKLLPPSVAQSAEDLQRVAKFFENELKGGNGHNIDSELHLELPEPQHRTERSLRSFTAMANRGLYSFDIDTYLKPEICYFRVAMPIVPVQSVDLPSQIRDIVGRTELKGRLFRNSSRIPYEDTLGM